MNSSHEAERPSTRRTVEIEGGPNQRLQVELSQDAGGKHLVLRELSWGNGVGWFVHKSIRLESGQVDGLLRALCCLRQPRGMENRCPLIERMAAGGSGEKPREQQEGDVLRVDFSEARRGS
jgi:hypothetical protein